MAVLQDVSKANGKDKDTADLMAQLEALKAENQRLKEARTSRISFKVSEKGASSRSRTFPSHAVSKPMGAAYPGRASDPEVHRGQLSQAGREALRLRPRQVKACPAISLLVKDKGEGEILPPFLYVWRQSHERHEAASGGNDASDADRRTGAETEIAGRRQAVSRNPNQRRSSRLQGICESPLRSSNGQRPTLQNSEHLHEAEALKTLKIFVQNSRSKRRRE